MNIWIEHHLKARLGDNWNAKLNIDATKVPAKVDNNQDVIIREYQKLLFQDDPPLGGENFKGIKFMKKAMVFIHSFIQNINLRIFGNHLKEQKKTSWNHSF